MGGLPTGTVNGFAVDPTNPSVMYVAMRDGLFHSGDAGARWTSVAGGPKNAAAVAVNPKRPSDVYAVTADGTIFLSRDGGRAWQSVR